MRARLADGIADLLFHRKRAQVSSCDWACRRTASSSGMRQPTIATSMPQIGWKTGGRNEHRRFRPAFWLRPGTRWIFSTTPRSQATHLKSCRMMPTRLMSWMPTCPTGALSDMNRRETFREFWEHHGHRCWARILSSRSPTGPTPASEATPPPSQGEGRRDNGGGAEHQWLGHLLAVDDILTA